MAQTAMQYTLICIFLTKKYPRGIASGSRFLSPVGVEGEADSVPPVVVPEGVLVPERDHRNDEAQHPDCDEGGEGLLLAGAVVTEGEDYTEVLLQGHVRQQHD